MQVGEVMDWHKVDSNYGHIIIIRVVVKKIGKRVTVQAPLKNGGSRVVCVRPESLRQVEK